MLNPADAATLNISAGDDVRVFNDRGELAGDAVVSDKALPGTVVATFGYWPSLNGGNGVNSLTSAERQGFAGASTFYDVAVNVALTN
jgi:anaerobic selenocysteine-containing dehydrogenase